MFFEFRLALRYLIPRKKALSTAVVSFISVGVISLVVWLVLIFLSVTSGIERNWLHKLTSLHAPVRITPTDRYYQSYFYQIDSIASASGYTLKTIGEKAAAQEIDPYSENTDPEPLSFWSSPERTKEGQLRDLVKELFSLLDTTKFPYQDYEIAGALLRLTLHKGSGNQLSQMSYLLSLTDKNPLFASLILPPSSQDLEAEILRSRTNPERLRSILANSVIEEVDLQGVVKQVVSFDVNGVHFEGSESASWDKVSILKAKAFYRFDQAPAITPPWAILVADRCQFPPSVLQPLLLPKSYRDMGIRIGDRGSVSFAAGGAGTAQEQRVPAEVVGFYDPGLFSFGGRCLIVPSSLTRIIHASTQTFSPDGTPTNGVFLWSDTDAEEIKQVLEQKLEQTGLASYWKVDTYKDYEFSKELFQQFKSDRTLFMLIAVLVLLVACCNIISLLVLLVNDKKREIAILQAMGASRSSIALIFGLSGLMMGAISSLVGLGAALLTLRHLDVLVKGLSALQGHAAFQPAFFGASLPNELSVDALCFVLIATPLLSLLAGLVPALRASRIETSLALKQP